MARLPCWRYLPLAAVVILAACMGAPAGPRPAISASPPAPGGASAPASPAPAMAVCRTAQLAIAMTHTGAVTGELGGYLTFTNRGPSPCRLSGWPAVAGVLPSHTPVPARRASQGMMLGGYRASRPLPVLRLRPGMSAYAVVANGDVPVHGTRPCPHYRWLRVTPPGNSRSVTMSAWLASDATYLPACRSWDGAPELMVSPVLSLSVLTR